MRRPQKTCAICESAVRVVDYKDERTLSRFLTERAYYAAIGRDAVTSARQLALLPYIKGFVG